MCDREAVDANTVGEFVPWTATIVRGAFATGGWERRTSSTTFPGQPA
jgi:hypothetical protein